jgi:hypothetical protein
MPLDSPTLIRFRNRREAEKALSEIVEDGGRRGEYRIDEQADGACLITILESDTGPVIGAIGA